MVHGQNTLGPKKEILGKQIRPNFLLSTSLLSKILPTTLGTCKPTFYTFMPLAPLLINHVLGLLGELNEHHYLP